MPLRLSSSGLFMLTKLTGRRLLINAILIVAFIALFFCENDILRFGWQVWTGKKIEMHGLKIDIMRDYFVFPTRDDDFLMVGRFDNSDETFPDDNYLTVSSAKVKFDLNSLPDAFLKLCKKVDCKEYKEYSYTEVGVPITCVEFKGTGDILSNREFHVSCRAQGSNVLVEYDGNAEAYSRFKEQQQRVLKNIIQAR